MLSIAGDVDDPSADGAITEACRPEASSFQVSVMSLWRNAGLTYLRYSQIAAAVTRAATKQGSARAAPPAAATQLKLTFWENGKPKAATSA